MIDIGKDLQNAYEEGYKQGRYDEKVETEMSLPQRWIPVSERLPEEGQMCLVCDKGYIGIDTYLGHGGIFEWKIYVKNYDAWMPLPEPYKEGGQDG